MLDSGASTSIISLDLVRRLKLRVEPRGDMLLNGIDGVKTNATNKCRVKITLGHRVVYTLDVWVGNIGQDIDVLLGMNFMVAARVRLCAHEGEVVLPDEERILLVGDPKRSHLGRTIDVSIHESLWLAPGDSKYIPIRTSEPDLESMDVWVSRGGRWVTLVVFSAKRVPGAVRVVNISRKPAQVLPHTKVATLTDRDRLPLGTNFVRPGPYQFDEQELLVYENTRSPAVEHRLDAEIRERERNAPPMVDRPTYPTPTRVLRRTPEIWAVVPGVPEAHPVSRSPGQLEGEQSRKPVPDSTCGTDSMLDDPPTALGLASGANRIMTVSGTPPESVDPGPQSSRSESPGHDAQASSRNEPPSAITASLEPVPESPEPASMDAQVALARSFVMTCIKNQLAYLLDLSDLRPEANIDDAIVGEPGESNPEEEERLRAVLQKHQYSNSEWASAIALVMKKNGTDVRLCIDYWLQLRRHHVVYDPGHGERFWAVPMTARAQLISAFIYPLEHFQWKRMPFGLKNAPLIYQQLSDNCLWGFVRLPPEEERLVDPEVLEFLGISPEASDAPMGHVLSRSSYIDDIIYGAPSWDDLCKTLNALLYRLRYWNISVSLPKGEFGVKKCKYLGHEISSDAIRPSPKLAEKVLNLPFLKTQKGVQSFLGSLHYYAKFIEDLPVLAAT
ncbi:hypothetical protein PHMEG_00014444, partial [Phytophthora megakarya]